jgi:hypothetical protein
VVVAVNAWDEPKEKVAEFAAAQKLGYLILLEGSDIAEKFGAVALPSSYWIDPRRKVLGREQGFSPHRFPAMVKRVEKLLGERKAK